MKTVALFSPFYKTEFADAILLLFKILHQNGFSIALYEPFYMQFEKDLKSKISSLNTVSFYNTIEDISNCHSIFSLGGDGTFLKTASFVGKSGLPIMGLNLGRLGFLADTSINNIDSVIQKLSTQDYRIETRSMLELTNKMPFDLHPVALNEIAVHKISTHSMLAIHTWVDNNYLSTYWADGIVISTPTGSTGYSLSIGGPIICPQTPTLILNPIAPHSLTVRPLIIPDNKTIKLRIESRENKYVVSLDSSSYELATNSELIIQKANFYINIIKMRDYNYFDVLRQKLMWGADKRN